jgi:hypothetical protein
MKSVIKTYLVVIIISICFARPQKAQAQDVQVSFQVFYDELSPYGHWVDYGDYGNVWVPNAGANFTPYSTGGHWVYTDYGWTWESDYSWGWAPFHYGRWNYDNDYGWIWIPGEEWGPAWVSWRSCDGYYGWCPMGYGMDIGVGYSEPQRWRFVRREYITSSDVSRHYEHRRDNAAFIGRSTVINRTGVDNDRHVTYVSGPQKEEVEKSTGGHIVPLAVHQNSKPGQSVSGTSMNIYRPGVVKSTANSPHPIPAKVEDIKTIPKRSAAKSQSTTSQPATTPQKTQQPTQHKSAPQQNNTQQNPQQHTAKQQNQTTPQQKTAPQQQPQQHQQAPQQRQQVPKQQPQQHQQVPQQHQSSTPSHQSNQGERK